MDDTDPDSNGTVVPVDTDGDEIDDYLDLDSDNDGIPDAVEAQPTTGYESNDGIVMMWMLMVSLLMVLFCLRTLTKIP